MSKFCTTELMISGVSALRSYREEESVSVVASNLYNTHNQKMLYYRVKEMGHV